MAENVTFVQAETAVLQFFTDDDDDDQGSWTRIVGRVENAFKMGTMTREN